ncbi:DNA helicase RecQ [Neolewinella antarctica]|uniref:DNA helicase RecQ n=1 Tax=Neolewinella antarctica TaxID=442734 RepID=A0ABX0XC82_9BACT|nr:DNA helicase RecQ [Neolewinella antarctica]NJC26387.1 ATP-dependent DNA helicase RecQ [Neolewinella antarctica]
MTPELAKTALKKYFGYDGYRPLQLDIITKVYKGQDGIVLMPTGGGKSVCFQIPAVTMNGTVVVVSPLISLMKDQVDGLNAVGIRAAYLNSSQSGGENHQVETAFENGELHLLYVSPEKLLSNGFLTFLKRRNICLFAIDEAHCISSWGHDFRPEYTRLKSLREVFPKVPILALTATADRLTRRDMAEQLGIPDAEQHIASFNRPNLSLAVRPGKKKREQIIQFLRERPDQAGIVYCLSRKQTENLAEKLREAGYNAQSYHAGLHSQERAERQADFINDRTLIICATIAFGMGIDKSNVRWVIHYSLPKNLENYYQEIGRAGRDGAAADTLLFYSYNDYTVLKSMISENANSELQIAKLDRMKEYADSLACRRRILLNYFSEDHSEDCGNCDICANPPERFDGTILAQQALSAVYRLKQSTGVNLTIDVLRGSARSEIRNNGYDRIKTYGAGRDTSSFDWGQYFNQLISLGYLYVAHEDYNKVKLTPAAQRVLFEQEKVELVKMSIIKDRREQEKAKTPKRERAARVGQMNDSLFDLLKELRKETARAKGLPPYLIFHDSTLQEMATTFPVTEADMARISGVGEVKLTNYGDDFMKAIKESDAYAAEQRKKARRVDKERIGDVPTHEFSLKSFQSGNDIKTIAKNRSINEATVLGHLAKCYVGGADIDLAQFIPAGAATWISEARAALPEAEGNKPIVEWVNEKYGTQSVGYGTLKILEALETRAAVG